MKGASSVIHNQLSRHARGHARGAPCEAPRDPGTGALSQVTTEGPEGLRPCPPKLGRREGPGLDSSQVASGLVSKTLRHVARDSPVPGVGRRAGTGAPGLPHGSPRAPLRLPATELNPFIETGNPAGEPFSWALWAILAKD